MKYRYIPNHEYTKEINDLLVIRKNHTEATQMSRTHNPMDNGRMMY